MTKFALVSALFLLALVPGPLLAKPAGQDLGEVMAQLERAEANQSKIVQQLGELKQELEIVKVRASLKQWLKQP